MYFLTDEERKQLLRGYLPKARERGVAEELRGWNWHQPPLEPVYDTVLAIYEVANGYCPTNRDLYLRRVQKVRPEPSPAMVRGKILHAAMVHVLVSAKRLIYTEGVNNYTKICQALQELESLSLEPYARDLAEDDVNDLKEKVQIVTDFETSRIVSRIQEILIKQPYIGEDSLVNLAVPVVVEQRLDGSFLGLSSNLSTDAFTFCEPMIMDLKFGEPKDFHRLCTTGYAMVMEAIYEFPVNIGCLVYAKFQDNRLIIKKDLHVIDDELRQWFIEARDDKARMIYEEIDPGTPEQCPANCYCYSHCHS
ncbi:MAG: type I-A CRISPR-associated protein Cas4/Csa1 [Peptococcaceae bacterium]|nr:type I-A CRISPR-associated protein Cas4/Csa1 [Peptococcaceae bacterium]